MTVAENSKVLNQSKPVIDNSQVLKKLESQSQRLKVLSKLEPKILKSEVLKNSELKVVESNVPRGSEVKVKTYPRQNIYRQKVWNESRPYYKAKYQSNRNLCKTNLKGPIIIWVSKSEIVFVTNVLKGKDQATTLILGHWLLTT